ncbi:MAG TPA: prolipoprotein diacylglyceryl transferase [Acidimicrobiales bacterium]|nr:prolipoprotein diacylglyceryl transferase [Acidimicrobiales bacterium]
MPGGPLLAYLPSPPVNGISIGPVRLHMYGLLIACGVVAAVWLAQRRWETRGGKPGTMAMLALWGVPAGLVGARVYSLVTSWQADTSGDWLRAFAIWQGGLGIWGGVAGGVIFGLIGARRHRLDLRATLDCATPSLALAQGIGRWGNYFNQELYGKPSGLPWAVKITNPKTCTSVTNCKYLGHPATFQPTFLYESIWDIACVFILIWAERRLRIRKGYLFLLYAALYTAGRFWTEFLRVDEAHRYWGLRINDWVSIGVFVVSVAVLLTRGRARPGDETVAPEPLVERTPTGPDPAR